VQVEPTEQRHFGCSLVAIAKRSTLARLSRSSSRSSAAGMKALTVPECTYQNNGRN
jgi:hypothetical protein